MQKYLRLLNLRKDVVKDPNNKISGGKILSNKIPKVSNRLKIALRQAANAVGNRKDTALTNFFKRIAFRGRTSAISATAGNWQ